MSRSVSEKCETDLDIRFTKNKKIRETDIEICLRKM